MATVRQTQLPFVEGKHSLETPVTGHCTTTVEVCPNILLHTACPYTAYCYFSKDDSRRGQGSDGPKETPAKPASATSSNEKKQPSVSDTLGAAMPGSFLTATDLQELARVYVVCLK